MALGLWKSNTSNFEDSGNILATENDPLISSEPRQQQNYGPSGSFPQYHYKLNSGKNLLLSKNAV
jgi:hypothetical protein